MIHIELSNIKVKCIEQHKRRHKIKMASFKIGNSFFRTHKYCVEAYDKMELWSIGGINRETEEGCPT